LARHLSWIEIDAKALRHNVKTIRGLLPPGVTMMAVVKGNAYGHGMLQVARLALEAGADWLGVFNLQEAEQLRSTGVTSPIMLLGYVPLEDLTLARRLEVHFTVSSLETLHAILEQRDAQLPPALVHIKVECGTHRLGLDEEQFRMALHLIKKKDAVQLEGIHTHFANIEDTTEHDYARGQMDRFQGYLEIARRHRVAIPRPHTACTAATLLFPQTYHGLVRVGIGLYGLWPSKETYLSALLKSRQAPRLQPVMSWKTRVIQVKNVPAGAYIGYGCTYRTTRDTRLAILPVGYANGYDRQLSNRGHVLIAGRRAPIRGRVCMNLTMVDVSDIPQVKLEDEVVLLGRQGEEEVSAELMAGWSQTINYEIVTRADPFAPRRVINGGKSK